MNLSEQLTNKAKEHPNKTALIFQDEEMSYLELDGKVTKFSSGLAKLGYKKGDHIALVVGNSPYYVIGLYGALRLGVVIIPINPLYTPHEMAYILNESDVLGVITMDVLLEKFVEINEKIPKVSHYISCETSDGNEVVSKEHPLTRKLESFTEMIETGSLEFDTPKLSEESLAIILFTSGTTGKPKGVMLTNKNLFSNAKDTADYLTINKNDRVIATLPMFHVFCLTVALNAPLMNGGTILIMPSFSPKEVFRIAKDHQATIFLGVPTMYNYLLQTSKDNEHKLSSIRLCISGGDAMPVSLLKEFEHVFNVILSEGYGLSEASPVTAFNPLDRPRKPGSIGRSILNVKNKVVDEYGNEVESGVVGELVVKGPNVMKGYYNMPEETATTLKGGWLFTGDMAWMDKDEYFYIVDRKKDMIIVGGYNVYPREVEEVLYSHPNVSEAAVVGISHPETGESVIAYVVPNDVSLSKEALIEFSKSKLASYKIPAGIEFTDELPKNATGKILRAQLRKNTK